MNVIDKLGKVYYCPLRKNRLVDDSEEEFTTAKLVKIRKFAQDNKVKLFPVVISPGKTEYKDDTNLVRQEYKVLWQIEQLHRQIQQLTGTGSEKPYCL